MRQQSQHFTTCNAVVEPSQLIETDCTPIASQRFLQNEAQRLTVYMPCLLPNQFLCINVQQQPHCQPRRRTKKRGPMVIKSP